MIHVGRPPIARWTVAHYAGQKKPKSADALPRVAVPAGWLALVDAGSGAPAALALPSPRRSGVQPVEHPLADGRRALALAVRRGRVRGVLGGRRERQADLPRHRLRRVHAEGLEGEAYGLTGFVVAAGFDV